MGNCCGNCQHHKHSSYDNEYYCDNEESDAYGAETDYNDVCVDYEEKI